ncbi:riboflavin biosynthesis protein RibD [Candidatus Woesearchaeota archaeon CG10_big_fil_rev_8_21_14_0_10_34_8]|nr:MAG: riboflavin biosynthesis protein RibD [Candidatus Woesearchaeota archaeon CG10_big_fil_rev_8_21_14_0_10_34_8]
MEDKKYMNRALMIAKKASPAPNPQVGAVLVKNGKIIGEGYHAEYGGAHAEIAAINDAEKRGNLVDGATLYVTLEPCSHHGKTPPCIDSIMFSGIVRVVIGCVDQNKLVAGAGIETLVKAGIKVNVGVLGEQCNALYGPFFHYTKTKKPFVTLKAGMTSDGKIALEKGKQVWITGKESLKKVHELRRDNDVVLVGIGTVLADNPRLTCRVKCNKQPVKVIVDSKLKIPLNSKVLADNNVIIATTAGYNKKKFSELRKRGIKFIVTNGSKVNLKSVLMKLPSFGILSVLVEGGNEINTSLLEKKLVDRICFFVAPKKFGKGLDAFNFKIKLKNVVKKKLGNDTFIDARIK